MNDINKIICEAVGNHSQFAEELFELYLLVLAKPIIKGDITAGKLKWRGIKYVVNHNSGTMWIEQRGERISPIITNGCVMIYKPIVTVTTDGIIPKT